MVSISEARQQIVQQRQVIQQQQQQIQEARTNVEQTQLKPLTRAELQVRVREDIITRKLQTRELEGLKKERLSQLDPLEKEVKKAGIEIDKFEQEVKQAEITERRANQLRIAKEVFLDIRSAAALSGIPKDIQEKARIGVQDIKKGLGVRAFFAGIEKVKKELLPEEKIVSVDLRKKSLVIETTQKNIVVPKKDIIKSRIVFGNPEDFGRSFNKATGTDSFTIAIPISRENGKIRVQDFNFRFDEGKLVSSKQTGSALLTEKQFLASDKRRRDKNPDFTFGDTRTMDEKIIKKIKKVSVPLTQKQIDILNIKDPLKFFVVSTLPQFGKTIFEDLVNNPKDRQAIRNSLSKIQKKGDETIEKLEDTREKAEEFLDPKQKEFRIETEKNFDILTKNQEVLNADIKTFNKKFVGELTQEEFDDATLQATTFTARQRTIDQKTFELTEKVKRLRGASEFEVETFFKSTLKGIVTSPITLAQLGIAASTRPIKTTKDFTKAVKEFPSTFGTTPFSTAGQLFGTVVGTKLITDFIFASPQLFKGGVIPVTKPNLQNALRRGGKTLDNVLDQLKKLAKDKKGEITIAILVKKKKKKKKKEGLDELTEALEKLDELGDIKSKNILIDESVKVMLSKIRAAKTLQEQQKMTLALNKAMDVWKRKGIIKLKPPIFELVRKPTRPIGSKKTASELRIVPQRQLQTSIQKRLVSRFRTQKNQLELFKKESSQSLKKQRQQLLKKQSTALALAQKSRQTQTQKDRQATATAFSQVSAQASKLKTSQAEALKQSTALASALLTTQARIVSSQLSPAQVLIGKPKLRRIVRVPKKPIIPKISKAEKEVVDTRLIKAVQKLGKKGVNIIVGMKVGRQKTIAKNLPKWKALRKAQRFVDTNIEASYLLKKSGKKAKGKDIKPFTPSFKFRSSKANALFVVESRKFRLDTSREVSQLKTARLNVPKGFFPTKKRKRRKKKR